MTAPRRAYFLLLALLALATAPAAAESIASPSPDDLIRDLASPMFQVRERASKDLWSLGARAIPALQAASDNSNPEVARRARTILAKFQAGVFPDTPPEVYQQIRAFRTGLLDKQQAAVTALVKFGPRGIPALRSALAQTQDMPKDDRSRLFDQLGWTLRREVPRVLVAGQLDTAEDMLSLNAIGPSDISVNDYAMLLALRNRATKAIPELEAAVKSGGGASVGLVAAYRAAGDMARARSLAQALASENPAGRPVYEALLEDAGAWSELANRAAEGVGPANSRDGLTIFRLRMAGRAKEADELCDQQKDVDVGDRGRYGAVDEASMALMLGGRPLEGIERMRAKRNVPHILADILAARLDFSTALDLEGGPEGQKADAEAGYDITNLKHMYGTRRGKMFAQLGDKDEADKVFNHLAEQLSNTRNAFALTQLLKAEVRAGRFDLACEHGGKLIAAQGPDAERLAGSFRQDSFEALFDADADSGQFWWRTLHPAADKDIPPGQTMRLVRALLTGTAAPADFDRAMKIAAKDTSPPLADTTDGFCRAMGLSTAYRAAGRPAEALAALTIEADRMLAKPIETDAPRSGVGARAWVFGVDERFRVWMELGDLLTEVGRHRDAADRYFQGWQRFPDNPILLFLSGRALLKANDVTGKQRVELSHWISLGNARIRGRFLEELVTRGYAADAKRERDLIQAAAWLGEASLGNVWNQVARASVLAKDYTAAALANRRAVHYLLRTPGWAYVEGYAYLTVPQGGRVFDARARLAAGKVDEAISIANECLDILPGNSDVPLGLVPELDKLGRGKDADAIFRRVWDAYGKVAGEHPRSAWARQSAAWLAAGCRRELDKALEYAKAAVELEPEVKVNREALAEVQFRRGDRAAAVALMQSLSEKDPRNHQYRRYLERYRTAAFDSPLPETGED